MQIYWTIRLWLKNKYLQSLKNYTGGESIEISIERSFDGDGLDKEHNKMDNDGKFQCFVQTKRAKVIKIIISRYLFVS